MGNSFLEIKPHKVSKDLRGYSVLFYGDPKSGKTTIAAQFPGAVLLAFEKGYNAIPGIMAKPMNSWGDFKKALSELRDPEVKELFQTVVIDTADIAYQLCEKYICGRESTPKKTYESISDLPYGQGYKLTAIEFDESIRKILQMDYGLILISHATDKTFKNENGEEYNQIIPTLDNKARLICERTCDIIGYSRGIETEEGKKTKLFMRGTPRYVAGSRFKYTPDSIDFTYQNLVDAIASAIDKEAELSGKQEYLASGKTESIHADTSKYDFPAMMEEFKTLVNQLMDKNQSNGATITNIVNEYLGKGKKVSDCTEDHAAQLDLILFEMKKML